MAVARLDDELDDGFYVGTSDAGSFRAFDGAHQVMNVAIHCIAQRGTGMVTARNLPNVPWRDHAKVAIQWLFGEEDPFLRSNCKNLNLLNDRYNYDFSFYLDPHFEVFGLHLGRTFCLAAAAMAVGCEMDQEVS